ncbi:hypothetical protein D9M70_466480 [compost metagenome]
MAALKRRTRCDVDRNLSGRGRVRIYGSCLVTISQTLCIGQISCSHCRTRGGTSQINFSSQCAECDIAAILGAYYARRIDIQKCTGSRVLRKHIHQLGRGIEFICRQINVLARYRDTCQSERVRARTDITYCHSDFGEVHILGSIARSTNGIAARGIKLQRSNNSLTASTMTYGTGRTKAACRILYLNRNCGIPGNLAESDVLACTRFDGEDPCLVDVRLQAQLGSAGIDLVSEILS